MTKQDYERFLSDLEKFGDLVCEHEHNDCDHNRCMACIDGCYGDVCAFGVVEEAIERLERESNDA
jgi:hypothetical protein